MRFADVIFYLLLFLAVIIVFAGVLIVTAGGEAEKVERAKRMILYSVIGIVVALLAKGLVSLVVSYLMKGAGAPGGAGGGGTQQITP
jgi:hypothetical protein